MTRPILPIWAARHNLRLRLTASIVAAAVLPLVAVVAILGRWTYTSIERQSVALEEQVASAVESEIRSILNGVETQLLVLDEVLVLGSRSASDQEATLRNLLANSRLYQEVSLVDVDGGPLVQVSRARASPDAGAGSEIRDQAVASAVDTLSPYVGVVYFDEDVREPIITVAVPMIDRRSGTVGSVVVASVRFKPIWDLLGEIVESGRGDVYVVTAAGDVIAHSNPAVVLSGTRLQIPEENGHAVGLSGAHAVIAIEALHVGNEQLLVIAELPKSVALRVANRLLVVTVGVTVAALLIACAWAIAAVRRVVKPIETLAASAEKIATGDLAHRASVTERGEIGKLAETFNSMTLQLSEVIGTLEDRVEARTEDLEHSLGAQRKLARELATRNRELEEVGRNLRRLVESKDEFVGSVSHELRTPLTAVLGFAMELRDRYASFADEDRRYLITTIAGQAQEMSNLVEDLLVAARGDSSELIVDLGAIDLGSEIEAVLALWPEISVRVDLRDLPALALGDSIRVRQIMRNLVGNSIRHGGPDIAIEVDDTAPDLVVRVRDNGAGIPAGEWEAVFEAYHTARREGHPPSSVGLGLTVSRTLARRMGGNLGYRYEDGHSIFELTLPRHPSVEATGRPARPSASTAPRVG